MILSSSCRRERIQFWRGVPNKQISPPPSLFDWLWLDVGGWRHGGWISLSRLVCWRSYHGGKQFALTRVGERSRAPCKRGEWCQMGLRSRGGITLTASIRRRGNPCSTATLSRFLVAMVKQTISKLWGEPAMCITPNWQYLSPKSWTKGDVRFNNSHHRVAAPSSPLASLANATTCSPAHQLTITTLTPPLSDPTASDPLAAGLLFHALL